MLFFQAMRWNGLPCGMLQHEPVPGGETGFGLLQRAHRTRPARVACPAASMEFREWHAPSMATPLPVEPSGQTASQPARLSRLPKTAHKSQLAGTANAAVRAGRWGSLAGLYLVLTATPLAYYYGAPLMTAPDARPAMSSCCSRAARSMRIG